MSTLIPDCGKPEQHDPHWVVQSPEDGIGGVRCEGYATLTSNNELLLDIALNAIRKRSKNSNPIQVEHIAIAVEAVSEALAKL